MIKALRPATKCSILNTERRPHNFNGIASDCNSRPPAEFRQRYYTTHIPSLITKLHFHAQANSFLGEYRRAQKCLKKPAESLLHTIPTAHWRVNKRVGPNTLFTSALQKNEHALPGNVKKKSLPPSMVPLSRDGRVTLSFHKIVLGRAFVRLFRRSD